MKHFTLPRFWEHYRDLPDDIQDLADRKFELLKSNPRHPSLHLKKIEIKSSCGRCASDCITEHWEERSPREPCGSGSGRTPSTTDSFRERLSAA